MLLYLATNKQTFGYEQKFLEKHCLAAECGGEVQNHVAAFYEVPFYCQPMWQTVARVGPSLASFLRRSTGTPGKRRPRSWWRDGRWLFEDSLFPTYPTKTSVACAVGPSVTTSSIDFSFPKPGFLEFIWIFTEDFIQYSRTFAPQVQTPWNQPWCTLLL